MIRFYILIILFLISLLCIFKAPEYHLWLLAINVTEFPMLFASITIFMLAIGIWIQRYQMAGTVLGLITLAIFLSPIVRAYWVSKDIKQDMAQAFGTKENGETAFSFFRMFKSAEGVKYKTIAYVKYSDTSMAMDFYPAQLPGGSRLIPNMDEAEYEKMKRPCVIVVHGGSWAGGDSQQLPELNSYLALRGYNVASINYRMAPKWQTPAPVEDIKATIAYCRQHADELHIDTDNFILIGRSAGAQIALLAAYTMHEPALKGVVDFYGPADMVWGYSIPSNPLIMDSRKVMEQYIGGPYSKVPQKYVACSPLEFVNRQSVPTLIIHGNNDVLVSPEHSRRLDLKLTQNGIKHYWLKLPWATHGFDYNLNGPGGQLSTYAVETFLKTVMGEALNK
ncbi:alpha/beta hydrolase [Mucilaginibacter flavidus]|uniref:alpha/beta hydrolase n=1 Tax=Mucilaginibacter flavidus TaxID=2949309 RepID=UPI002091FDD7|nr:alpha/beta hydrolase [Mucilaginibacter flavidus]MCO5950479.1 alpha/beta hydrolase [Mucilaginibacter flavidus]